MSGSPKRETHPTEVIRQTLRTDTSAPRETELSPGSQTEAPAVDDEQQPTSGAAQRIRRAVAAHVFCGNVLLVSMKKARRAASRTLALCPAEWRPFR